MRSNALCTAWAWRTGAKLLKPKDEERAMQQLSTSTLQGAASKETRV